MRSTLIPAYNPSNVAPLSIGNIQKKLVNAQQELSSGRLNDVGYALAERLGADLDVRAKLSLIETVDNTNKITLTRVDQTQNALTAISDDVQKLFEISVASASGQASADVALTSAREGFKSVISTLNTSSHGMFVFGGINTSDAPLEDYYSTPAPASKAALDAAFLAEFGFAQNDPAVQTITPAAMESFIDNAFSDLFDLPAWKASWSSASDASMTSRISLSQTVQTSVTANEDAVRKATMAFAMASDLGLDMVNGATFKKIMSKVSNLSGQATGSLNELRGRVGATQEHVAKAQERLTVQKGVMQKLIIKNEGADATEAAMKVNLLSNQLETAYTLIGQMQNLMLSRYI